ncbi:MAG: glycosyltransferase family 4 protein [Bacteroidia bacterium]|nr:glycosyltransferase family 4 protein [Bacteroidia bacterium]
MPFSKKSNLENKIRILYIIHSLNIGGSEKVLIDSINGLDRNKYQAHIIALSKFNSEKSIFRICKHPENVAITYLDYHFQQDYSLFGYLKVLLRAKSSFYLLDKIIDEISAFRPDIIHFHTGPRELRLKKFFAYNAIYIFTDHTLRITREELGVFRTRLMSFIFRRLYSGFHVICVSLQIQKNLLKLSVPDPPKKIMVLPNSVDTERFKKKSRLNFSEGLKAVYVSRIDNNKGHEELIRAWAGLNDIENKQLFVVGPDHLNGKIQTLAHDLKCADSIIFTGSVSDTHAILENCNLGVFPSHKEGLPLSLLEKMSMSLPMIISDIPELRSVCTNEYDCVFFKVGDAEDIEKTIRRLYQNRDLAEKISENARKTVEEKYSAHSANKLLDDFYTSLLN